MYSKISQCSMKFAKYGAKEFYRHSSIVEFSNNSDPWKNKRLLITVYKCSSAFLMGKDIKLQQYWKPAWIKLQHNWKHTIRNWSSYNIGKEFLRMMVINFHCWKPLFTYFNTQQLFPFNQQWEASYLLTYAVIIDSISFKEFWRDCWSFDV